MQFSFLCSLEIVFTLFLQLLLSLDSTELLKIYYYYNLILYNFGLILLKKKKFILLSNTFLQF